MIDPTAFVHPEAVIIGDVTIGPECYIGPFASLRGDFGRIVLKRGSNIQDSCTLHSFPEKIVLLEEDCHVGHGAILHGCLIKQGALIGMNSLLMDGVVIGAYAFVGACSLVTADFEVPSRHLARGNPAKIVRQLTEKDLSWKADATRLYQRLAQRSISSLKLTQPREQPAESKNSISWDDDSMKPLYETKSGE